LKTLNATSIAENDFVVMDVGAWETGLEYHTFRLSQLHDAEMCFHDVALVSTPDEQSPRTLV
jgi:hypothetical protein